MNTALYAIIALLLFGFVVSEFTPFNGFRILVLPIIIAFEAAVPSTFSRGIVILHLFFWILLLPVLTADMRTDHKKKLPPSFYCICVALLLSGTFASFWFGRAMDTSLLNILSNTLGLSLFLFYPAKLLLPYVLAPWIFPSGERCEGELLSVEPVVGGNKIHGYSLRFEGDATLYYVSFNRAWWYKRRLGCIYSYKRFCGAYGIAYIRGLRNLGKYN